MNKATTDNIVFAKGGVEYIIEKPDAFIRKYFFRCAQYYKRGFDYNFQDFFSSF